MTKSKQESPRWLCGFCKGPLNEKFWCTACDAFVEEDARDLAEPVQQESFQGGSERPMLDNWVAEFSLTDESDVFDEFTLDDQAKIWGLMRIAWDTAASRQRQLLFTRLVELRDEWRKSAEKDRIANAELNARLQAGGTVTITSTSGPYSDQREVCAAQLTELIEGGK